MKIIISNASPDPIYEQIIKQIKAQILSGVLAEGDRRRLRLFPITATA